MAQHSSSLVITLGSEGLLHALGGASGSTGSVHRQQPNPPCSHAQISWLKNCPSGQLSDTHAPPHSVVPLGHWHTPPTHCSPSSQRLKQRPQWRSFLFRFTHLSL